MSTFNVGDRVRVVSDRYAITKRGWEGMVLSTRSGDVQVRFDNSSIVFDIDPNHLERISVMPESFVNADHYDTQEMMFDLLDLSEFRAMLRANYDTSVDGDDLLYHVRYALVDNLNSDELADFKRFVREHLGWEDPAIAAKRKRINELKEELSRLEKEIESR